jgi:hypothetical protein
MGHFLDPLFLVGNREGIFDGVAGWYDWLVDVADDSEGEQTGRRGISMQTPDLCKYSFCAPREDDDTVSWSTTYYLYCSQVNDAE